MTSECASGHAGSQDHRQHLPPQGTLGGIHAGSDFPPRCLVCSSHKIVSVRVSVLMCAGLYGTGEGTVCASMDPIQDLGTLTRLRATPWGQWAGELCQGGCSHPRLWPGTGQLLGAFLLFISGCHWIVSTVSGAKPRMARSPGPVHASLSGGLGETGSSGLLGECGLGTRKNAK